MNYLKLKDSIEKAIHARPLEIMAAGLIELLVQRLTPLYCLQVIIKEMRCRE